MPLGSANDFGNILGWGQLRSQFFLTEICRSFCCFDMKIGMLSCLHLKLRKYPGDVPCPCDPCGGREALGDWKPDDG